MYSQQSSVALSPKPDHDEEERIDIIQSISSEVVMETVGESAQEPAQDVVQEREQMTARKAMMEGGEAGEREVINQNVRPPSHSSHHSPTMSYDRYPHQQPQLHPHMQRMPRENLYAQYPYMMDPRARLSQGGMWSDPLHGGPMDMMGGDLPPGMGYPEMHGQHVGVRMVNPTRE